MPCRTALGGCDIVAVTLSGSRRPVDSFVHRWQSQHDVGADHQTAPTAMDMDIDMRLQMTPANLCFAERHQANGSPSLEAATTTLQ
jgi:hypothetical protein